MSKDQYFEMVILAEQGLYVDLKIVPLSGFYRNDFRKLNQGSALNK